MGKIGPLGTQRIHGSKSTKLHLTNKSQKKLGLFLVGIFGLGQITAKSSQKTKGRGSKNVINMAHDTKMMQGRTLDARSFTFGGNPTKNTKNARGKMRGTRGEHEGNTRENTQPTRIQSLMCQILETQKGTRPESNKDDKQGNRFFYVRRS